MKDTWEINITGRVQGVGFRPFVFRLANTMNLPGEVLNTSKGVTIYLQATTEEVNQFIDSIKNDPPFLSKITSVNYKIIDSRKFQKFEIVISLKTEIPNVYITPDYGICKDCQGDIIDSSHRKYGYGFASCTNCGPRYSIITGIPYDRQRTSMSFLYKCEDCWSEYNDSDTRFHHGQSLTCPECRINVRLWNKSKELISKDEKEIYRLVSKNLLEDKIIAVKGMAGFLLLCNAGSEKAVSRLRRKKHRKSKPLAVMVPNMDYAKKHFEIDEYSETLLRSESNPIVLVKERSNSLAKSISPNLTKKGIFLPPTPLLYLLVNIGKFPVVATSGNVTGQPLFYEDASAIKGLSEIADQVLTYDRKIVFPQDDSVIEVSPKHHQKIVIRRSRGIAPEYMPASSHMAQNTLAFGADIKASFGIAARGNIYISQYLGDLSHYDNELRFAEVMQKFTKVLSLDYETVLVDSHPGYISQKLGLEMATRIQKSAVKIPHHRAHFSAILGEHNLWKSSEKVLGVIWDGAGYGEDRNIWGGEFFTWEDGKMRHIGNLSSVHVLAGDEMSLQPRISALSFLHQLEGGVDFIRNKFRDEELRNYLLLLIKGGITTTSIGRLFDAVASLLGLADQNDYEGHAAMLLENEAVKILPKFINESYPFGLDNHNQIIISKMLDAIINDLSDRVPKPNIAFKFHHTLAEIIGAVAKKHNSIHLAFSGGVFQNALLVDLIIDKYKDSHSLYFHNQLPPNDENISFGQLMYHHFVYSQIDRGDEN